MTFSFVIARHLCRHSLAVAVPFWAAWLALVLAEAALGAHAVLGILFGLSLPLLVALLTWSSLHLLVVVDLGHRLANVVLLGASVLLSASIITGIGLLAVTGLKSLVSP